MNIYKIRAIPKPRMTQSDKWKKRPCVLAYRKYCDDLRAMNFKINIEGFFIQFVFAVPKSVSKKERLSRLLGDARHQIRPDIDNLCKSILDALYKDDSHVWMFGAAKIWGEEDEIIVWDFDEYCYGRDFESFKCGKDEEERTIIEIED